MVKTVRVGLSGVNFITGKQDGTAHHARLKFNKSESNFSMGVFVIWWPPG